MTTKRRYRKQLVKAAYPVRDDVICTLATEGGFYAKTIAAALTKRGMPTGVSTVYNVLAENGISLRDYRRAKGKIAQARMNTLIARHVRGSKGGRFLRLVG